MASDNGARDAVATKIQAMASMDPMNIGLEVRAFIFDSARVRGQDGA